MLAESCENFFESVEGDVPEVKLMKYRYFLTNDKDSALSIKPKMLKIALDHQLIGEYEMIHEISKTAMDADQTYKKLRQIMSSTTIKMINESVNLESVNNTQNLAPCYKNIADTYFKFGEYKEAFNYYRKLFRLAEGPVKREQYFTQMALSAYYLDEFGELSMFVKAEFQKNSKRNMIDFSIICDLKGIEVNPQADSLFDTIIDLEFTPQQIMQNKCISFKDIGYLYSLISIAYHDRNHLKRDIKWSSKIQNTYLRKNYKKLLETIAVEKKKKCFTSLFVKVYENCEEQIRKKIMLEVISCFDRCPYAKLKQITGIQEGEVLLRMKKQFYLPLLNDPVSQSFVFQRKSIALLRQIFKLDSYLRLKYEEEVKRALKLSEDDEMEMGGMMNMARMMQGRRF